MSPYDAWNVYHYARDNVALKVAGVIELRVDALPVAYRKGLINIFERGYAITENKKDIVLRVAQFIAGSVVPPFDVSYIGKTRFNVYLSAKLAEECEEALRGTDELSDRTLRKANVDLTTEAEGVADQTRLRFRIYQSRDQDDRSAHMQDKLGPLRHILTGYLERDRPRRIEAIKFLKDDHGVLRGTFTGQGRLRE